MCGYVFASCTRVSINNLIVLSLLSKLQVEKQQKLQIQTRLCSLSLSDRCVDQLYSFIQKEDSIEVVSNHLRSILKNKGQVATD